MIRGWLKSRRRRKLADAMMVSISHMNPLAWEPEVLAERAYQMADAMLSEENKKPSVHGMGVDAEGTKAESGQFTGGSNYDE